MVVEVVGSVGTLARHMIILLQGYGLSKCIEVGQVETLS